MAILKVKKFFWFQGNVILFRDNNFVHIFFHEPSFDHLLNARRFNGYVYKEENVYGDRTVDEYIHDNALMQLMESDRIKEKIRNFEQDMWSY